MDENFCENISIMDENFWKHVYEKYQIWFNGQLLIYLLLKKGQ